jgi:single-strand DNA-binding protein
MNKVFLIGNLTKDPEIRVTSTGKKVASFSVAVNEGKDANGQEIVQYFNFSAWDKKADILELYVKKGHKVAVFGRLQNRSWTKPDNTTAYATDIVVADLEILTSKAEAERLSKSTEISSTSSTTGQKKTNTSTSTDDTEEDEDSKKTNKNQEDSLPEIDVNSLGINLQMPF